ncbi:MAG: LLM class flavin-dependent oxidoreductase [Chloroflexi bacterium]|nr:LLM class flavin-dependent oxidoreductase [Chloroflexota bacterium]
MQVWFRQTAPYYHASADGSPTPFPVPGWMWDRSRGQQLYTDRMRFIRRLDELGFDGIIFTEHHSGPNGGLMPSPIALMAAASQVTERAKLISMGVMLSLYPHPVRVAEELALVDNLSHGRLVPGFISATAQNLYAYNVSPDEERARYHEAYDLIVKAWTAPEPFEWHSEYYQYPCVSILPRPVQQPHPPTWTTAVAQESIQWAARKHMGFMSHGPTAECAERLAYYRAFAADQCEWSPCPADLGISRELYVAPSTTRLNEAQIDELITDVFEADAAHEFGFMQRDMRLQAINRQRETVRSYEYLHTAAQPFHGAANSVEGRRSGQFLAGDPETLIEDIIAQQQTTGAGVLVIRNEVGAIDLPRALEGLELFAREVLPVIQRI